MEEPNLEFKKISEFQRGVLSELLRDGYSFDSRYQECFGESWDEFDDFFFDNLDIADKYGFITVLNGEAIGLVSWDPRKGPEYVAIGHNCIVTRYKRNGYGKRQLEEALNRIRTYEGLKKIKVETNNNLVAKYNYESVGFKLIHRQKNEDASAFSGDYLTYEIIL